MTAKELKLLVYSLKKYRPVDAVCRSGVEILFEDIRDALKACGKTELAKEIQSVIDEIDSIDTEDIMREEIW